MRRKDREITSRDEMLEIIRQCECLRLGLCDGGQPYVVPMNFGLEWKDDTLTLFLHGAQEGRKLDILRGNPKACFEMDRATRLLAGDSACAYSMEYESVIGFGRVVELETRDEKRRGLSVLMRHYAPKKEFDFPDAMLDRVCVLRFDVERFSGKRHKRA